MSGGATKRPTRRVAMLLRGKAWAYLPPVLVASLANAQYGGINAEFAGGGARALAMGGSFIALADDATATEFNPAGLWQLRTPELALQAIYTCDRRQQPLAEASFGLDRAVLEDDRDSYIVPSFASFVYPTQHFVVGLTEFTNVYYDRRYKDKSYLDGVYAGSFDAREKAENYAYGLTLATALGDALTVGTTLRYNTFRFRYEDDFLRLAEVFESEAPSANFGAIWRVTPHIRVGGVYKSRQKIEGTFAGREVDTHLPDTIGAGIAFLPNKYWRILADVDRVRWSQFDPDPSGDYAKDDVWRYHLGAEWYAHRRDEIGIFLRGGFLYEESNAFKYTGSDPYSKGPDFTKDRDPVLHYTIGVGFGLPGYQVDLGCDATEENGFDMILSTVVYF